VKLGKTFYAPDRAAWRAWLKRHHQTAPEIWLVYYKNGSGKPRIPYNHAVEEALCFGWIDSILKPIDARRYAQRFSPRRATSVLSAMNRERVRRLIKAKRMTKGRPGEPRPRVRPQEGNAGEPEGRDSQGSPGAPEAGPRSLEALPALPGVLQADPDRLDRGRAPPPRGVRAAARLLREDDGAQQAVRDGAIGRHPPSLAAHARRRTSPQRPG
jgi:hypothetical protein